MKNFLYTAAQMQLVVNTIKEEVRKFRTSSFYYPKGHNAYIIAVGLFMICTAFIDLERTIDLFEQHHSEQLVRKGHC